MVEYLKNLFKKKDDENAIPEIHLPQKKNFFYDEKKKKWVIEGEEDKEDSTTKLPPPKSKKEDKDKKNQKKNLKGPTRYASILGDDNIYTPDIPKTENKEES